MSEINAAAWSWEKLPSKDLKVWPGAVHLLGAAARELVQRGVVGEEYFLKSLDCLGVGGVAP